MAVKGKEETTLERLHRLVNEEMPKVIKAIMDDKKLTLEQKATMISQANVALHQLRILRGAFE